MIIEQIEVDPMSNFCYLVACDKTREAMVIDPSGEVERLLGKARELNLQIRYIVNTHRHGDHTAGTRSLKSETGAAVVMHQMDAEDYPEVDLILAGAENRLTLGTLDFQIRHTPGHTPGGICLYAQGQLFTGDTLFVGDSGRTDLPGGHRPTLGASIRGLMQLPDDTVVWPGHNYGPTPSSTLAWEKRNNINAKEYGYYVDDN
jgi:glyoxylase-like metal-dependent hydrolase (beta-lactamase superfamily II)